MHKPLSYLTKICKQFSSKATPATSNHEDHNINTNADTSATIAPSPITNCTATTSTSSPLTSSYYSTGLYSTSDCHSHSSNGNNSCNSCNSCNSNVSYIGSSSSSSLDPREYSNSNQGYSSTAQSLCYDQGASFETEFGYSSPAYSHNSNSNYQSNTCHNQVANLSYSNSNSAYGMLINNDRTNSMESLAHSNSLPTGTAGTAYGVGAGSAGANAGGTGATAYDGAKFCNGAGAITGAGTGVRAIKVEGELCSSLEVHNNDSQALASNHKLGTNNDCSTTLNDGSHLYNHHMAPTLGDYQQDELGLPVEEARSLNGSGRTLLNNCCDNHNQDHTQRAESDDDSCTGVHSLGCTTFAYAKDKYGAITKVDTKATDEILSNKEDELNDIQKSTCTSGPFSPAQRAALQAQCPITQSSLWQQVVGQHGQAKLGPGEVMLPELDPMHAGNHSYQLIHSLYNIANEGYLRFDAVSEGELIRANQGEISTLLRRVDGSAEELNCYLIPLIKAMVRCCSIAPASMYHHHDDIGGLIRHNLQIANDCIEDYSNFAHAKVTVANTIASLTEQRKVKKQAEAAYLANIQKQAALENKVKSSYEKFQESLGLIDDDDLNDGLNTDLNLEVLNTNSSPDQKYADLAKTMGLMLDQSFADGPIESLATIFDDDQKQSTSNGTSTGAGADTNTATANSASTATGVASNAIAGMAASGVASAGDGNRSGKSNGSGDCDTTLALSKLKHVQNNPSSLFNGETASMDNWDSLNLLQRAKAFGLLTYVEDEQIAQLASAYSGSNTNSDVALEAGKDPYLVGLGANLIGATSTAEAYEKEMGNIKRSLFEDAFVKKICDLNLSQGSLNDYNSTVTKQRKDTFSGLINQIRMEAQNNNIGRFDRYQLDLIVQLSLIFFSFAHDLGKLIHDMEIFNDRGERYNPHLETLANFAEQTQTKYLYLRYITSRSKEEHSHTSSMFSGVRLLSSMCPDLVALIYQVFNLDAVLANKSHPINLFVASHDRINSAQITKTSNMYLKNFAAQMVIELVKSRLRADALAQMQIARIQMLAQEQGIDLSSDFDLSPSGHNLNSTQAKAQAAKQCDFDNLWQEITPKAHPMASTAAINQSSPSLSANSSLSSSNGSSEDNGSGQGSDKSCSKNNADQTSTDFSQGMSLCKEQGTNTNDSNSSATSLHLNNAQGPANSLKPDLSDPNGTQILQELLDANKQDHNQDDHRPIHNSVRSFREQMKEDGCFAYLGNDSNALNGEHLYKFNAQKQNELLKNKRIKDLQKEQYHWAVRIFKSARRSLSVNELGSDLYVEGNTVLLEQGSRALSTLNMAYQNYCYGHLAEQFSSCKSDFKTHLQVQKLSETYMSNRDYSWFAIAVGDDLVIVKGIDLRLIGCDFGSDVAIINLGINNPLIEELTLDLANYILYNIRQS